MYKFFQCLAKYMGVHEEAARQEQIEMSLEELNPILEWWLMSKDNTGRVANFFWEKNNLGHPSAVLFEINVIFGLQIVKTVSNCIRKFLQSIRVLVW